MEKTTTQRQYTTPQQKIEIINSPLSNVELSKIYGISNKSVSQIRRRAGIHKTGASGGAYNRKLTDEQIKEILETKTPSRELAAKFHVTYEAVWLVRKKNGITLQKKPQKIPVFLTSKQREEVANSNLSTEKLAKIYNVEKNTILKIKRKAGKGIGTGKSYGGKLNTKLTESQKKEIIESDEYIYILAEKYNVSVSCISRTRIEAGARRSAVRSSVKHPVKSANGRVQIIKEIKQPIKKRTINLKKSQYEEEKERKAKAEKAAKVYHLTEKEKLESGLYAWKMGPCRSRILAKIN